MKKTGKKRISRQNKLQTRIIVAIVLVVFVAIGVNSYGTYVKYQEFKAKEAEVDLQIAQAEAENAALIERENYMKTDEYVKDMAKDAFGMVESGEYVLKSNTKDY